MLTPTLSPRQEGNLLSLVQTFLGCIEAESCLCFPHRRKCCCCCVVAEEALMFPWFGERTSDTLDACTTNDRTKLQLALDVFLPAITSCCKPCGKLLMLYKFGVLITPGTLFGSVYHLFLVFWARSWCTSKICENRGQPKAVRPVMFFVPLTEETRLASFCRSWSKVMA